MNEKSSLRVLVVTYEFTYSPFSGNGILARSLVKSLLQQECLVTVWCCRPHHHDDNHHLQPPEISLQESERLKVIATTISKNLGWRRLDRGSAWHQFCWSNVNERDKLVLQNAASSADVVLPIDWTGSLAWQSLSYHVESTTPVLYLNFRVFSLGIHNETEREWYQAEERQALEQASLVVVLSEKDRQVLCELMSVNDSTSDRDVLPVKVLLPPLRGDMEELAVRDSAELQQYLPTAVSDALESHSNASLCSDSSSRCLVTCVARLSPEKHVQNYVEFVKANYSTFERLAWIPFLAGSAADEDYANKIKRQLRQVAPNAIIVDSFLSPNALAAVFSAAVVNFHPCEYDAYGMTIMEAAAMGVPSIVQGNNQVGATVMLQDGACIQVDMKEGYLWNSVTSLLTNEVSLREIGQEAKKRALAWDEAAYGRQLVDYIHLILPVNR